MEWYDFFTAGAAAAAVWPAVFFPGSNPAAAIALSISTFALTYFSRPLGAFIFGHLGDKYGRKSNLVWTMVTMAFAMFGMALTPSYASVSIIAPVLIGVFRLLQGIANGGEYQGGITWVAEFAPIKRRGFWTSIVHSTLFGGILTGTLAFYIANAVLPRDAFFDWGWRVPFFIGGGVAVFAALIRYKFAESPLFGGLRRRGAIEKQPALRVLRERWKTILHLWVLKEYLTDTENINLQPLGLAYMVAIGIAVPVAYFAIMVGAGIGSISAVIGGAWSDYVGRRRPLILCTFGTAVFVYPFYLLVNTKNTLLVVIASIILFFLIGFGGAALPAAMTEQFATRHRVSGVGYSWQFGALTGGIVLGVVLPFAIASSRGLANAWPYIAAISAAVSVGSFVAALAMKETKDVDLASEASTVSRT